MTESKRRSGGEIFDEAVAYLTADGWPTHDIDEVIADRVYNAWLRDTDAIWNTTARRPRELLWEALEEVFNQHYGDEEGQARSIVFSLLLEARARREGQNQQSTAM